jgi:hypothetical protein
MGIPAHWAAPGRAGSVVTTRARRLGISASHKLCGNIGERQCGFDGDRAAGQVHFAHCLSQPPADKTMVEIWLPFVHVACFYLDQCAGRPSSSLRTVFAHCGARISDTNCSWTRLYPAPPIRRARSQSISSCSR